MTPLPNHIHQIWIGSNPCPEIWVKTIRSFCYKYKYNYTLWNEHAIQTALNFDAIPGFRKAYSIQESIQSIPGQCDLLRYLILWTYGGLYIDADVVIANPRKFHTFLQTQTASLFFAWEEMNETGIALLKQVAKYEYDLNGRTRLISNSVIGAQPRHPFFYRVIEGSAAYSEPIRGYGAWREVGPGYITNLYDASPDISGITIYPMRFFYPVQWGGITDPEYHLKHPLPAESMLFQYGYSTNRYSDIFRQMGPKSHIRGTFRARHKRQLQTRRAKKSPCAAPPAYLEPHSQVGSSGNAGNSGCPDA